MSLAAKQFWYARRSANRTGARRRTRRQIAFHAGRRIRARRNGTYSGRRTWCSFARAGDRHRPFEGATGWSRAASAEERQSANETSSQARSRESPQRRSQETFTHAFPCHERCAQTREPQVSIEKSAVTTSKAGGGSTLSAFTFGCRKESRAHAKTPPVTCRRGFDRSFGWRSSEKIYQNPSHGEFQYARAKETSAASTSRATARSANQAFGCRTLISDLQLRLCSSLLAQRLSAEATAIYLRPPFLPPLRELDLLRFFPRPPPPFFRPPLSDLFTVAHARRSASLLLTPRFL